MVVHYNLWKEGFETFAKRNHSSLRIVQNPSVGYAADYVTLIISVNNILISQRCSKINVDASLSYLILEYSYPNQDKLNISLYKKDWVDRFFKKQKIRTGNGLFDSRFNVESSDKQTALRFFGNSRIQEFFINNPLKVFNIETKKEITKIKLKDMEIKLHSQEELQYLWDEFKYMVKIILNEEIE